MSNNKVLKLPGLRLWQWKGQSMDMWPSWLQNQTFAVRSGNNFHIHTVQGVQIVEPDDWVACNKQDAVWKVDKVCFESVYQPQLDMKR